MSTLPTLMIKGKLQPHSDDPAEKKIMDETRPIDYILEWFRVRMGRTGINNRVLVLKSETASGKSTMLPPELYMAFVRKGVRGLICTQPRVLTAITNSHEIVKNYKDKGVILGETIGWSTKYNKFKPTKTGILSATIGTLLQQLKSQTDQEIMELYQFILIDETHERDLQTDLVIYMLKNLLLRCGTNPMCPFVVLMSATFEPQSFLTYFDVTYDNFIWCRGGATTIDEKWDWNEGRTVPDYPKAAVDVVEQILRENPDDPPERADILIFMPGKPEFKLVLVHLLPLNEKMAAEGKPIMSISQIDGDAVRLENTDYHRAITYSVDKHRVTIGDREYIPARRCIITTNVAETGLTLPNLKYVIDGGFNRENEYYPTYGANTLITKPAPVSRIRQRRGRCGRKFPGVFYPLYPQFIYDRLPQNQLPQIMTNDISSIILDIIHLNTATSFDPAEIDMIDSPGPDALADAIERAYMLGYIHVNGRFEMTPLGDLAYKLSMPLEMTRMILAGYYWNASILDLVSICAYLTVDNLAVKRKTIDWARVYADGLPGFFTGDLFVKYRLLVADEFINGIILISAVMRLLTAENAAENVLVRLRKWCEEVDIEFSSMSSLLRIRDDIIENLLTNGFNIFSQEEESLANTLVSTFMDAITRIKYCIYDGYRCNLLVREGRTYYTRMGVPVVAPKLYGETKLSPAHEFAAGATPNYVIYKKLSIVLNKATKISELVPDTISCLDGFIAVDY